MKMFRRKMALEKAEGSLEKIAMGNHEREKEGINKVSAQFWLFKKEDKLLKQKFQI